MTGSQYVALAGTFYIDQADFQLRDLPTSVELSCSSESRTFEYCRERDAQFNGVAELREAVPTHYLVKQEFRQEMVEEVWLV